MILHLSSSSWNRSGGFPNYLKALDEIGYKGYLTIERKLEITQNQI